MKPVTTVEVYSSFAYAVEPRAFEFEGKRHVVDLVEWAWKSPGRRHFYVRDEQQQLFELIYDEAGDRWFVRTFGETCPVNQQQEAHP